MRLLARAVWIPATLLLGLVPSVIFFVWVEALGRIPPGFAALVSFAVGTPGLDLGAFPPFARAAFDASLLAVFGLVHTALAQVSIHERLARLIGTPQLRAFYVIVTGLTLAGVMLSWQYLGGAVWAFGGKTAARVTQVLYYLCLAGTGFALAGHGMAEFLGFAPIWRGQVHARTAGTDQLVVTGLYARVRHPGYMFLLAAFGCAAQMTLDRAVVWAATAAYLVLVGIPIEERKLTQIYGAAYEEYRQRVPMLFPRLRRF